MACQPRLSDAFRKDNQMEKVFREASQGNWNFIELARRGRWRNSSIKVRNRGGL